MEVTLETMSLIASQTEDGAIRHTLFMMKFRDTNYEEFVASVERGLVWGACQLAHGRQNLQTAGEDAITDSLMLGMRALGFEARSNVAIGGHCDVVIEYRASYLWLGEAKIYRGAEYLWKGYKQLTTRYSNSQTNESRGGMLIYCFKPNLRLRMKSWKTKLKGNGVSQFEDSSVAVSSFYSNSLSAGTAEPFKVFHLPLSLHFDPKDRR